MKKVFLGLFSAVVAFVSFVSCGDGGKEFGECIPEDASVVMKMNFKSIFDKSGVADMPEYKEALEEAQDMMPSNVLPLYEKVMKNPAESGFDVNHPFVVAVYGNMNKPKVEFLLRVVDRNKVTENLRTLNQDGKIDIREESGVTRVDADERNISIAYDDDFLIFTVVDRGTAPDAASLLKLEKEASIVKLAPFADFANANVDAAIFCNNEEMMNFQDMRNLGAELDLSPLMKDVYTVATFNFETGKVVATSKLYVNDKYQKYLDIVQPTSGKFLNKVPANSYFVFGAAIKNMGDVLSEDFGMVFSMVNRELRRELNTTSEELLNSIDGDITFFVAPNLGQESPIFGAYAELKDRTIWDVIDGQLSSSYDSMIRPNGRNSYIFNTEYELGVNYVLSYKDNVLSFEPEDHACRPTIQSTQYADLFELTGMLVNLEAIFDDPTVEHEIERARDAALFKPLLDRLVALTVVSKTKTESEMCLTIDTPKNSLAFLVEKIKEAIEAGQSRRTSSWDEPDYDWDYDDDDDFDWSQFDDDSAEVVIVDDDDFDFDF